MTARDAAGNESAASSPATATTPCGAAITSRAWNSRRKELTVRATCTRQPTAALSAYNGSALLGAMSWKPSLGAYQLVVRLAARPACVRVAADCGGSAQSCF